MKSTHKTQQLLLSVASFAFVFAMFRIADSAAQFAALAIFIMVPVTIAYAVIRVAKYLIKLSDGKRNMRLNRKNHHNAMSADREPSIPENALSGEKIMEIPAYARMKKGFHYPITKNVLDSYVLNG
ncbi:hypothetical protein CAG54_00510 [Vibrio sp. V27_P1S3P104]|uniref:hypothetical protein n=1 Tax=unclassified Vibrio TaxID=2614977 RepID=UPI001372E33A|nr:MULTISPECIES: hypothetical protein [unclassified Vibrio]NAX34094.1 hypothetical protein [Vibrio sp. V29_P1S30P107]NAX36007.1 hypothetical protein [Vibrio sp. V27_P1S3P104]